jgi:hypothetical protein
MPKKAHVINKNIDGSYAKTTQEDSARKTNPISAKGPDKGKIVSKLYCILLTTLEFT